MVQLQEVHVEIPSERKETTQSFTDNKDYTVGNATAFVNSEEVFASCDINASHNNKKESVSNECITDSELAPIQTLNTSQQKRDGKTDYNLSSRDVGKTESQDGKVSHSDSAIYLTNYNFERSSSTVRSTSSQNYSNQTQNLRPSCKELPIQRNSQLYSDIPEVSVLPKQRNDKVESVKSEPSVVLEANQYSAPEFTDSQHINMNNNHPLPLSKGSLRSPETTTSTVTVTSYSARPSESSTATNNIPKNNKFSRNHCPMQNKGLIALIILLMIITISTLGVLVYFGLGTSSTTKPPAIPDVQVELNQTIYCGVFPRQYLPLDLRSQVSIFPFNPLFPTNDARVEGRVVGGSKANIRQYPWQVSLWIKDQGMTCGGTIIMKSWVLTAAHCFAEESNSASWEVYVGMSALSQRDHPPAQRSDVSHIIIHDKYSDEAWYFTYDYDIAILKLRDELTYSDYVQPICIPPQDYAFQAGKECFVSGWGSTTSQFVEVPDVLQHAQVDIIATEVCSRQDWLGPNSVSDRMLCAGKAEGGADACHGDSGGPLSCYDDKTGVWTLAGSVSWGFQCGHPKLPGVYAKMSFFTEWIWVSIGRYEGRI